MTPTTTVEPLSSSLADVARRLGCSRSHLNRLARAGELPGAYRLGHRWFVNVARLAEHIDQVTAGDLASHPLTPREVTDSSGRLSAQGAERDDRGPDADSAPVVAATRGRGVA